MPTLFDLHGIDLAPLDTQAEPEKSGFARRALGDTGVSLLKGAIGVPEAIVGAADLVTGGHAGRAAEAVGFRPKEAKSMLDEWYSPEQQAANREVQQAQGFWDTAAAAVRNPSTIVQSVVESAPSLLPAGAVARGARFLAPGLGGAAAAGLGEGVVSAGQTAERVRQETADGLLTGEQSGIAALSGGLTGVIGAVAGKIANRLGIGDVNQLVAGVQDAGPKAQQSFARALLQGFATEGVMQELPQSAQEQIAQNVALGKPWDEGVGNAAAMGALAGGVMGAGAANIHRAPTAEESMQKLATATNVGDMIASAQELANAPIDIKPPAAAGLSADAEDRALTAMERQMQADQQAIKFGGPREAGPSSPVPIPRAPQAPVAEASAEFIDTPPLLDRLQTLTDQLRTPEVRETVRAKLGDDALNSVLYYVQQANRPDGADGIPAATRERIVSLAETILGRALLDPTQSQGQAAIAPRAFGNEALAGTPAPATPQLGMAAGRTGTVRVDSQGNAAPETRLDAINTRQAQRSASDAAADAQAARAGIEPQGRRASAVYGEGLPKRPAPPLTMAERRRTDGVELAPVAVDKGDPVLAYVDRLRTVATPQARAFVQDFNAGRITRRDVVRVMQSQGQDPLTADERLQQAAAQAPTAANGIEAAPVYRSRTKATIEARKTGGEVVAVEGGFQVQEVNGALTAIDTAAQAAATSAENALPEPTQAQKEAGNYKLGHTRIGGLDISIENPQGSTRRGVDPGGKAWENTLQHHYGYIKGTEGSDGDHVDVFVKPGTAADYAGQVFVIDQVDPATGKFDEHKALIGFDTEQEARDAYAANYAKGWKGLKAVTPMAVDEFKTWVKDSDATGKPAAQTATDRANADDQGAYAEAAAKFNAMVPQLKAARAAGNTAEVDRLTTAMRPHDVEMRRRQAAVQNRAIKASSDAQTADELDRVSAMPIGARLRPSEFAAEKGIYWEKTGADEWTGRGDWFQKGKTRTDAEQAARGGLVEDAATKVSASKPDGIADIGEKIGGARKDLAESGGTRTKRKTDDERPAWARRFQISQIVRAGGQISAVRDEGRWTVRDTRSLDWMKQPKQVGGQTFATQEEAEAFVPIAAVGLKHRPTPTREGKYEIWRDITDRKRVKVVDRVFDTRDEAMRYMAENAAAIIETNTTFGEADIPLPPNRNRTGPARREGDVSGDDFLKTFGLRGVEFGNWNNQDERQNLMNEAWDGLMDLADVLGIPEKAIGLNGDLSLAFGARGHGLHSARAHYEHERAVINLTKEKGAGTLAHEWLHALDHYLGRQDGKASATWTLNKDGTRSLDAAGAGLDMVSSGFSRGERSQARPEVREAFNKVMQTIAKRAESYVADAVQVDGFVGRARDDLARAFKNLRQDLAEQKDIRYYKRNNKPASAELLAEFDAITSRAIEGEQSVLSTDWRNIDMGKNRVASRWTNDTLERLGAIYKEVRGRTGFSADRDGVFDRLRNYLSAYEQRLKMLAEAQSGAEKQRQVPTQFVMDAKELDQGRGEDYWTTPHELAARAFQAYVEDKIAERGNVSRFLNYAPEAAMLPTPWGFKRVYPAGQERQAINKAFDEFVGTLKTRETERGTALFSRRADSERTAQRWTRTDRNAAGPEFYGRDVDLIALREFDTTDEFSEDALPLGHNSSVRDGNTAHQFMLVDHDGALLGMASLEVNPAGEIEAIHDIEITDKRAGTGRHVISSILANASGQVRIIDILDQADAFWQRMGAGYKDTYGNATADWSSYRAQGQDARAGEGRGSRAGEELEAGRAADGEPEGSEGSSQEVGPKLDRSRLFELLQGSSGVGLPIKLAQRYADAYSAGGLHRVNVARNIGELPERLRGKLSGFGDDVRGAYFPAEDQVWVFSDKVNTAEEMHFVVIHEAFHRGLGRLFGDQGKKLLRQMYATNQKLRVRADGVAKELGISKDEAIEEALADMAGEGQAQKLRGWSRLASMVREWLRGLSQRLGVSMRFTDTDIEGFVGEVARGGLESDEAVADAVPQASAQASRGTDGISRRDMLLGLAAAGATGSASAGTGLGKASPLSAGVLKQTLSPLIEKTLRAGQAGGTTNIQGAKAIFAAMQEIARTGPAELRALAAQIASLLPSGGVMLTVDDRRVMNAHGAVTFDAGGPHLQLFTAGGRTGLSYGTFMHETLHLAVLARYKTLSSGVLRRNDAILKQPAPGAAKALEQLSKLWDEFEAAAKANPPKDPDTKLSVEEAVSSPDEFFVRALTDDRLQAYMAGIEYEGRSMLERFKDWVTGLFIKSGTRPSWLDAALLASQDIVTDMARDKADYARLRASYTMSSQREAVYSRVTSTSGMRAVNQQAIRDALADRFKSAGEQVGWWQKTVGTQYDKAKSHPAFGRVFNHVQQYIEDTSMLANEAADKAPAILPKLESVRDVFNAAKRGLSKVDQTALAAPVFEGTLSWSRQGGKLVKFDDLQAQAESMTTDEKAQQLLRDRHVSEAELKRWQATPLDIYDGAVRNRYASAYLQPGVVFTRAELQQLFKLNDTQVAQYEQFRAAVDESLDQVAAADALRLLGEPTPEIRAAAMGDRTSFRAAVEAFLTDKAKNEPNEAKRDQLTKTWNDIADKFKRVDDLKARGYAPLMRFGRYSVGVRGADGEQEFFGIYETRAEANRMARELNGDPEFAGRVEQGTMSQEQYKLFSGIPVESLEMFADALGAEQSAVFQEYLRLTKNNRSALKRLIKRKGTAGFSEEVSRVLASFVTSNARMAAGAMNLGQAKEAAEDIRAGDVKDEGVKLIEAVQNPTETAGAARGLMFAHFIGGSVASAIVNTTQPLMMTLPWLSQYGGAVKAAARLMASARMAAGGKIADKEMAAALARAEKDGIVSPQEIHHLTAEAMATWGKNPVLKRAAFLWGAPFSVAEQFNRRVTFLAAYQTAKAEGMPDPFAFAHEAVVETQGLYNKGNASNWSRNALGATALTFKQYSVHYLEWIKRMWNAGEPGSKERTEGRKAVLFAMALLFLAGGSEGLPFAEDLNDLADTVMQSLGFDTSAKGWKRDFLARTLGMGDTAADVAMRGLSAIPGIPLDVSMRMGMGNLLPGTGMLMKSNTDVSRDVLELAGPAGAMVSQYKDAGRKALDGDVGAAALGILPNAMQNVGKAATMWMNGEARDMRGRRVMATDELDAMMKLIGFQPADVARESSRISEQDRRVKLTRAVESSIADQWAQGLRERDVDMVNEAREQLREWNEANPESRIGISSSQVKRRLKDLQSDKASRFERSAPKEMRTSVAEAIR